MDLPFPKETLDLIEQGTRELLATYLRDDTDFTLYRRADFLYRQFPDRSLYNYTDHLAKGLYAPWYHEHEPNNLFGFNCTTVIPYAVAKLHSLGVTDVKIVQFRGFRDINEPEDKEKQRTGSHFGLIVNVGRKHSYLLDLFWTTYGPILEHGNDFMRIGKNGESNKMRREFERLLYWTPQEFANMMDDFHDPGKSVEMLMAGQQVRPSWLVNNRAGRVQVFYLDETNVLRTRLRIWEPKVRDKVVYCDTQLDDEGQPGARTLHFYTVEDTTWEALVKPQHVAATDYASIEQVKRALGRTVNLPCLTRIHPDFSDLAAWRQRKLLAEVEKIQERLSPEERVKLQRDVLLRTIYDARDPEKDFLFTQEQRDEYLFWLEDEVRRLREERKPHNDTIYFHDWRMRRVSKKEKQRVKRKLKRINKEQDKKWNERESLRGLRYPRKTQPVYDRIMDRWLLEQELKDASTADLDAIVRELGADQRIGHLAMIGDFIPFALDGRKELEFQLFMGPLSEKVKARRSS